MPLERIDDRRSHARHQVRLPGWLTLADDVHPHPCVITDVSLGGFALRTRELGEIGRKVIVHAQSLGRLEGRIARLFDGGFGVTLTGNSHAAEAFAKKLESSAGIGA